MCDPGGICVPATNFDYSDSTPDWEDESEAKYTGFLFPSEGEFPHEDSPCFNAGRSGHAQAVRAVDLNRDGADDLVWLGVPPEKFGLTRKPTRLRYALSRGDGTFHEAGVLPLLPGDLIHYRETQRAFQHWRNGYAGTVFIRKDRPYPASSDSEAKKEAGDLYFVGLASSASEPEKVELGSGHPGFLGGTTIDVNGDGDGLLDFIGCRAQVKRLSTLAASPYYKVWEEGRAVGTWSTVFGQIGNANYREVVSDRPCKPNMFRDEMLAAILAPPKDSQRMNSWSASGDAAYAFGLGNTWKAIARSRGESGISGLDVVDGAVTVNYCETMDDPVLCNELPEEWEEEDFPRAFRAPRNEGILGDFNGDGWQDSLLAKGEPETPTNALEWSLRQNAYTTKLSATSVLESNSSILYRGHVNRLFQLPLTRERHPFYASGDHHFTNVFDYNEDGIDDLIFPQRLRIEDGLASIADQVNESNFLGEEWPANTECFLPHWVKVLVSPALDGISLKEPLALARLGGFSSVSNFFRSTNSEHPSAPEEEELEDSEYYSGRFGGVIYQCGADDMDFNQPSGCWDSMLSVETHNGRPFHLGTQSFLAGDFNGDGRKELGLFNGQSTLKIRKQPIVRGGAPKVDLLVGVTDGFGAKSTLRYLPLTDSRVHVSQSRPGSAYAGELPTSCRGWGNECDAVLNVSTRPVVWQMKQGVGVVPEPSVTTTEFFYGYEWQDTHLLASLGFESIERKQWFGNVLSSMEVTTYDNGRFMRLFEPFGGVSLDRRTAPFARLVKSREKYEVIEPTSSAPSLQTRATRSEFTYGMRRATPAGLFYAPYFTPLVKQVVKRAELTVPRMLNWPDLRQAWANVPTERLRVQEGQSCSYIASPVASQSDADEAALLDYDHYNNLKCWRETFPDGKVETKQIEYVANDNARAVWKNRLVKKMVDTTQSRDRIPGGGAQTVSTRTAVWRYCETDICSNTSYLAGRARYVHIEPDDNFREQLTTLEHDSFGNLTSLEVKGRKFSPTGPWDWGEPLRSWIEYDSEDHFFPVHFGNSLGHNGERLFDRRFGGVQYERDANGAHGGWAYDLLGRLVYHTSFGGFDKGSTGKIELTRRYDKLRGEGDSSGVYKVTEQVTGSAPTVSAYDGLGRLLYENTYGFEGGLRTVYYRYNRYGHLDAVSNPQEGSASPDYTHRPDSSTFYDTDLTGQPLAVHYPNGNTATFARQFLAGYQVATSRDAEQGVSATVTGPQGELLATVDGTGAQRCFAYDASGALSATWLYSITASPESATPCANVVPSKMVRMINDRIGRTQKIEDPELGVRSFNYDALGRLARQIDAKGQTSTFNYDPLGRITREITPLGTTTYQWDTWMKGSIARVDGPWGAKAFVHDNLGRVRWSGESHVQNPTRNAWTEFDLEFDQAQHGRLLAMVYPAPVGAPATWSRPKVNYEYNPLGYLKSLLNSDKTYAYWTVRDVDAFNAPVHESWGVGLAPGQNPNIGRVERFLSRNPSTSRVDYSQTTKRNVWGQEFWVDQTSYDYDLRGRVTAQVDERLQQSEIFSYDPAGRLTNATTTSWANAWTQIVRSQTMQYRRSGDLASKSDVGTYTYGSAGSNPDALLSAGSITFAYDANGSMTRRGSTTMTYNGVDRLAEVWNGSTRTAKLTYDEAGQMIRRETASNGTWEFFGDLYSRVTAPYGVDNHYKVVAGNKTVAELTIGVNPSTFANEVRMDLIQEDHRSSPRTVVRELMSGQSEPSVQKMSYDVWGRKRNPDVWASTNTSYANNFGVVSGFTGHFEREDAGLVYMRARHYDPLVGQFTQPDTLIPNPAKPSGWSRYTYVDNDPVNWIDPSGHKPISGGPTGTINDPIAGWCDSSMCISVTGGGTGQSGTGPGTGSDPTGGTPSEPGTNDDGEDGWPIVFYPSDTGPATPSTGGGVSGTLAKAENIAQTGMAAAGLLSADRPDHLAVAFIPGSTLMDLPYDVADLAVAIDRGSVSDIAIASGFLVLNAGLLAIDIATLGFGGWATGAAKAGGRVLRAAGNGGLKALVGSAKGETLSRLGMDRESASRLARKAAEAEEYLGIHGVSVSASPPSSAASQASRESVESVFSVHDTPTRNDPLHRTVELPKPVTPQVAQLFNGLFGR